MTKRIAISGIAALTVLLILSGCGAKQMPDWYTVTGSGVAQEGARRAQAKLLAKRAARLDAQRQLLEAAKGIRISSESTVENFMTQDDYIRSLVEGNIRSAKITDTRYYDDGACEVDMKIDMNKIREIVR